MDNMEPDDPNTSIEKVKFTIAVIVLAGVMGYFYLAYKAERTADYIAERIAKEEARAEKKAAELEAQPIQESK